MTQNEMRQTRAHEWRNDRKKTCLLLCIWVSLSYQSVCKVIEGLHLIFLGQKLFSEFIMAPEKPFHIINSTLGTYKSSNQRAPLFLLFLLCANIMFCIISLCGSFSANLIQQTNDGKKKAKKEKVLAKLNAMSVAFCGFMADKMSKPNMCPVTIN